MGPDETQKMIRNGNVNLIGFFSLLILVTVIIKGAETKI